MLRRCLLIAALFLGLVAAAYSEPASSEDSACLKTFQTEADSVRPLVNSKLARRFLDAVAHLPVPPARTLFQDAEKRYILPEDVTWQSVEQKARLIPKPVTDELYYCTKYGTPLAYVRLIDLLGQAGIHDVKGKRILDYGYGTVGHLRLLACIGADAVGVDVDPFLAALYCRDDDEGRITVDGKEAGRITLVNGRWPGDKTAALRVGGQYDLIISKNTLKNGYIHPEREVDKQMLIDLGVSEEKFVKALHDALKPGGHLMIYNICPAPAPPDKPYRPWADGRCPFSRKLLESTGFKVIELDRDDSKAVRDMARAFSWDKGSYAMDLENDLFAHYTLLRRPAH